MKKLAVIGGGASGMIAAVHAASNYGCEVYLFEKNTTLGKKLLSTGNGRCNITNKMVCADSYNSPTAYPAIRRFGSDFTINYFRKLGLLIKTDKSGRCYPYSESATDVLAILETALKKFKVNIQTEYEVLKAEKTAGGFLLNGSFACDAVITAAGSRASVKGYSGYNLFKSSGIRYKKFSPSLCPVPLKDNLDLKGVRVKAEFHADERKEFGEIQFGENYISGICVMNLAKYITDQSFVYADFMPDYEKEKLKNIFVSKMLLYPDANADVLTRGILLPKLGNVILRISAAENKSVHSITENDIENIINNIKCFKLNTYPPEDFKNAQVCVGGVTELNPETLESNAVKGLFICGEAVDVDAPCGGFNLQWAWSSGLLAAESAAKYLRDEND